MDYSWSRLLVEVQALGVYFRVIARCSTELVLGSCCEGPAGARGLWRLIASTARKKAPQSISGGSTSVARTSGQDGFFFGVHFFGAETHAMRAKSAIGKTRGNYLSVVDRIDLLRPLYDLGPK